MILISTSRLLRFIAILFVIASHYAEWMFVEPTHPHLTEFFAQSGPFAVDCFFLASGYGLVKSAEKKGVGLSYIGQRLITVVIPYLIIVACINWYSGTWAQAAADGTLKTTLFHYLNASSFWYIHIQMVMYLLFFVCFRLGRGLWLILLTATNIAYSVWLYQRGFADFWVLSNFAFVIGAFAAWAERKLPVLKEKLPVRGLIGIVALAACGYCAREGAAMGGRENPEAIGWHLAVHVFFTVVIWWIATLLPALKLGPLGWIGDQSLFIYLMHTVLFYAIVFRFEGMSYAPATMITAAITLVVCTAVGMQYDLLTGALLRLRKKNKEALPEA